MTIWTFFIERTKITILAVLAVIVMGFASVASLPLESNPEVKIPIATVTTAYPGAAPSSVERLVTDPLEDRIQNLDDLDSFSSVSSQGVSSIVVQFDASADLDDALRSLRDEVSTAQSELPDDASDAVVTQIRLDDRPVITLSLVGNLPLKDKKEVADELQDALESISGVSGVDVSGIERREIQVLLNRSRLEGYGISAGEIATIIRQHNVDLPVGAVKTDELYYQIAVKGELQTVDQIKNLPVRSIEGTQITVGDVSEVREVFAAPRSYSSYYDQSTGLSKEVVTMFIRKETAANVTDVADSVRETALAFDESLDEDVKVLVTTDLSVFVREDVAILASSAMQTILIIAIILFFVLGLREALLVSASIPLIYFITFIVLLNMGLTLNGLVLFSLILSLGIVVDTAIIVMEGMYEGVRDGLPPYKAAIEAVQTYKAPLISGTLTTISAFFPMLLMTGITGEYVKYIPITITVALIASLCVALFLLPGISTIVFQKFAQTTHKEPLLDKWLLPIRERYLARLQLLLAEKKRRRAFVRWMVVGLVLAFMLPIFGVLRAQLFPKVDVDFFYVDISLATGKSLDETRKVATTVEGMIQEIDGVQDYIIDLGGSQSSSHKGRITVNLVDESKREKSYVISGKLRDRLEQIDEAEVTISELAAGPPVGAPIEIRVLGSDIDRLESTAQRIGDILRSITGTYDVEVDVDLGTAEYHLSLNRAYLSELGIAPAQVASEMRALVYGNDSISITKLGEELPIAINVDYRNLECLQDVGRQVQSLRDEVAICDNVPKNVDEVRGLLVQTPKGAVPLGELADISLSPSVTSINHVDGDTVVYVRSQVDAGVLPGDILQKTTQMINEDAEFLPEGVTLDVGGETESTTESFESLGRAMIYGVLLIALILVMQFNSFRQPFIIMFTLPLALIGVFFGLALFGKNLSFPGFIGIVALSGVVVNDAIVLIDRMNSYVARGVHRVEAAIKGGRDRFQPVLLTTVTTAFGVLPLAFTDEVWGDLAWTIFFGMLFATILTLFMVPVFYVSFYKPRSGILRRIIGGCWWLLKKAFGPFRWVFRKLQRSKKVKVTHDGQKDEKSIYTLALERAEAFEEKQHEIQNMKKQPRRKIRFLGIVRKKN